MGVQRSERAVRALSAADPQFAELCKMLYGDVVDPDEVWSDVFGKRELTPVQQEKRRNRTQARVALATNVLGLTAAAGATGAALRDPDLAETKVGRRLQATGNKIQRVTGKIPGSARAGRWAARHKGKLALGALGLQATNMTGDVIANRVLARNANTKVAKAGLRDLVRGSLVSMRRLTPKVNPTPVTAGVDDAARQATPHRPAITGVQRAKARSAGRQAGGIYETVAGTRGRKALLGATVAGAGGTAVVNSRRSAAASADSMGYYYGKRDTGAVTFEGEFSKFDDDKRLAFGWASVVEKDGMPVVDRQGDLIDADEIEKAAYDYVLRSRVGGDMHKRNGEQPHKVSDLVESFVVTKEKIAKMGLPPETPVGWWVGFKIHDDEAWQMVKKGERAGFSIHGRGRRVEKSMDEALGYK